MARVKTFLVAVVRVAMWVGLATISLGCVGESHGLASAPVEIPVETPVETPESIWKAQRAEARPWSGRVPHLFFHSLVNDPTAAFDGDYTEDGYRLYMVTTTEFVRILEQMEAAGWMLVDIHDLYREGPDGTITPVEPMVPPGRKPFVLSIDDLSYYEYMDGDGFAQRLEPDRNGEVATRITSSTGGSELTYDGDLVPILDRFVADNPDFSYQGVKGVVALTGYEGLFGYDVSADQANQPDFAERVAGIL